jgi:hypothetical protein
MKQIFSVTKEEIERSRAKLLEDRLELAKTFKPKKTTGNTRDAALREMLVPHFGTKVKVTKATLPKPVQPSASERTKEEKL